MWKVSRFGCSCRPDNGVGDNCAPVCSSLKTTSACLIFRFRVTNHSLRSNPTKQLIWRPVWIKTPAPYRTCSMRHVWKISVSRSVLQSKPHKPTQSDLKLRSSLLLCSMGNLISKPYLVNWSSFWKRYQPHVTDAHTSSNRLEMETRVLLPHCITNWFCFGAQ